MDNGSSLDDILNGTPAPEAEAPAVETPPVVEAEAPADDRPRDEHGRFIPKGDKEPEAQPPAEGAPPAPEDDASPTVPRAALQDERRKRQDAEARAARADALEAQLAQFQRQQQPPAIQQPQPIPDQWDDPEGYAQHLAREAAATAREEVMAEVRRERVMQSAEAAKVRHPDYLEKVAVFEQLSAQNPVLTQQMMLQPDPAEYAYGIAKQHQELSQYGSLEERDAALKAQWEAEALEKLKATLPAQSATPSLAGERNVGPRSGPEWSGPRPLADILAP